MRRRFKILLMGAVLGAAIAVPSTVMASGFAGRGGGMHMPGPMGGDMGMMSQMNESMEGHEEMMQLCAARMKEGHEGMMDGMGMMGGMGMIR